MSNHQPEPSDYPGERIDSLVAKVALKNPARLAVEFEDQVLSYAELEAKAKDIAAVLREQEIGSGQLVGVYMERSALMPAALLGIMKTGAAYVPMDPAYPAQRIQWMVEDASLKIVLTDSNHRSTVADFGVQAINVDTLAPADGFQSMETELEEPAYVIFTSGSTGRPKGVEVPHRALTNFVVSMRNEPGFSADDALLAVTTLSFDIAGLEMFLPLISGGRLVVASRAMSMDGNALVETIERAGITVMQATPVTWKLMLSSGWESSPNLKVLCGGEAFPRDLANALLPKVGSLWNMYGPTETTIWSTCGQVSAETGSVSIGRPIANTAVYIVDDELKPLPDGEEGELVIGGDGLAAGYLGQPELTADKFTILSGADERIYRTGDLARYLPDGRLECLGRIDQQIKLRGFRIELGEIETALREFPAVNDAAVSLISDSDHQELLAYLVLAWHPENFAAELRAWLADRLPVHMIPARFMRLETIPLTPNGKLDRKALPEPKNTVPLHAAGDTEYQSETEQSLAEIWRELIGCSTVPRDVDFFELGGDSLSAARMFIRIKEACSMDLTLAVLVEAATIEKLAARIDSGHADEFSDFRSLKRIQAGTENEIPMFWVHGGDGHVLIFRFLAENLGADIPVYAFQWSGMDGGHGEATITEMAETYCAELVRFLPAGQKKIRLGGFCVGGLVAVELARLLTDQGIQISGPLVIVGAPKPGAKSHRREEPESSPADFSRMVENLNGSKLVQQAEVPWNYVRPDYGPGVSGRIKRSKPYALARRYRTKNRLRDFSKRTASGKKISIEHRAWYCGQTAIDAMVRHIGNPWPGSILYFRSGVCHGEAMGLWGWWDNASMGFEELCTGSFETVVIGGPHDQVLKRPEVANLIRERFDG